MNKYPIVATFDNASIITPSRFLIDIGVNFLDKTQHLFNPLQLNSASVFLLSEYKFGVTIIFKYDDTVPEDIIEYYRTMENICRNYSNEAIKSIPVVFISTGNKVYMCNTLKVTMTREYINISVEIPDDVCNIFYKGMKKYFIEMCWNSAKELMRIDEIVVKNICAKNRDVLEEIRNYQSIDIPNKTVHMD